MPSQKGNYEKESKIIEYMMEKRAYSYNTVHNRLDSLKRCLYAGSLGHQNSAQSLISQKNCNATEELLCVHEMMYRYLDQKDYLKIEYLCPLPYEATLLADVYKSNDYTRYTWHVSEKFMPLLCIYAQACYESLRPKAEHTVHYFFKELQNLWEETGIACTPDFNFDLWTDRFLARTYFLTLESELCNLPSSDYRTPFRDSVRGLTFLRIEFPVQSSFAIKGLSDFLKEHMDFLRSLVISETAEHTGSVPYSSYNTRYVYPPNYKEFLKSYADDNCKKISVALEDLIAYINFHKSDSSQKYELRITGYDDFCSMCESVSEALRKFKEVAKQDICLYFSNIEANISHQHSLKLDDSRSVLHKNAFIKIVQRFCDSLNSQINSIKEMTRRSSQDNPENYLSVKEDTSHIKQFDLRRMEATEKFKNDLNSLPDKLDPFLMSTEPSSIEKNSYRENSFSRVQVKKILTTLFHDSGMDFSAVPDVGDFAISRTALIYFILCLEKLSPAISAFPAI